MEADGCTFKTVSTWASASSPRDHGAAARQLQHDGLDVRVCLRRLWRLGLCVEPRQCEGDPAHSIVVYQVMDEGKSAGRWSLNAHSGERMNKERWSARLK